MNTKIILFVAFCTLCVAYAYPESQEQVSVLSEEQLEEALPPVLVRHRRATCDLLSGFGVNHSACAAHCIAIGRKGGYCNGQAVCICRN